MDLIEFLEQLDETELFRLWVKFMSFKINWTVEDATKPIIFIKQNDHFAMLLRDLGTWISVNRPHIVTRYNKLKAFL